MAIRSIFFGPAAGRGPQRGRVSDRPLTAGILICCAVFFFNPLEAALAEQGSALPRRWPENNEVRRALYDSLVTAPMQEALGFRERGFGLRAGAGTVTVETERAAGSFYIIFNNPGAVRTGDYGPGSWIIKREAQTGALVWAKVVIAVEQDSFVRFTPRGSRTLMDVVYHGTTLHTGVPLGIPFTDLLTLPFADLAALSSRTVAWEALLNIPPASFSAQVRHLLNAIRPRLASLPDADDGAMDENGDFVLIESLQAAGAAAGLNCSGFVKWIADGLYTGYGGGQAEGSPYIKVNLLKTKHPTLRGSSLGNKYDADTPYRRDPYFGLDWTRNLAAVLSRKEGYPASSPIEANDVRAIPYGDYREDLGYPLEDLRYLLPILAAREPGYFYLGSVSVEYPVDGLTIHQHVHTAAFFPYYDEQGAYHLGLLERNVESNLRSLGQRYPKAFVHLVRVRATDRFSPPPLPSQF